MNVDVEIYMSNIIKFFNSNPNDLINLVPLDKKEEFFEKIRILAEKNLENGEEAALTQKQLIQICIELNNKKPKHTELPAKYFSTKFGDFCLN